MAYENLAKANADGHTLIIISATHTINTLVIPNWPHDVSKVVAPVTQLTSLFYVVYNRPSVPIGSFKDVIAFARANPNKLAYGTGGNSSISRLGWELIAQQTGVKLKHVAYKGAAPAIMATIAGEMQSGFATLLSLRPHIEAGRAKPLAVTSQTRIAALPDVPAVAELGLPGYEINQWYGVGTVAKVPPTIISRLNAAIVEAVKSPEVAQRLSADGSMPVGSSPEEFRGHIHAELAKWRKVLEDTGVILSARKRG